MDEDITSFARRQSQATRQQASKRSAWYCGNSSDAHTSHTYSKPKTLLSDRCDMWTNVPHECIEYCDCRAAVYLGGVCATVLTLDRDQCDNLDAIWTWSKITLPLLATSVTERPVLIRMYSWGILAVPIDLHPFYFIKRHRIRHHA